MRPALQLLSRACEQDNRDPEIWFYLGAVYGSLGDAPNAEKSFRAAIALRPDFVQARFNLANALGDQGRLAEAEAEYRAVTTLAPQHAMAWCALGYVCAKQDRLAEAEQAARRALALAPNTAEPYAALASVHLAKKELAEAIKQCTKALERDPNSISALVNLGLAHKTAGRFSEAKRFFNRALAIQPRLPEAHYTLGVIFLHEGNMDEAESAFFLALDHDPRNVHAFEQLGALLRHRDKRGKALELYRRFAEACPEHPDAKFFLAVLEGGEDPGRIPVELLAERYRDEQVASTFDEGMTKKLDYVVPVRLKEHMSGLLGSESANLDALDLGCGTGLYGSVVKPWTRRLVGVDLSAVMLAEARRKGVYDELVQGELIETLDAIDTQYDLVIAMDVLVFFGDLAPIFERVKKVLRPRGLFIFDLEKADESHRWQLHIFGNYVHSRGYITELAGRHGFSELLCEELDIRKEVNSYIKGHLVFFRSTQ
ncbi:methyltransferase [Sulfuricaulis limicola]|uniref:Methyltransferase n=2 Tax=Sulfuricaulis limicola TaxID=1620215 RepID=A0A1B4XGE7_9GAMM|nr:methyltransferase [Sulfuricaulis limicola]